MAMALSPGLDAIKASPLSRSAESLQLNDYLDLPSSPSLASAPSVKMAAASGSGSGSKLASRPSSSSSTATTGPPPPGSAPEVVFRYYLKLELKKMGSPADDATIDRHVAQHYGTFLKAMDSGKPTTPAAIASSSKPAVSSSIKNEYRHISPASTVTATSPVAPLASLSSMSPQPQAFKVPPTTDEVAPTPAAPIFDSIDPQLMTYSGPSTLVEQQDDAGAGDAMSEDGHTGGNGGSASFDAPDEDSKDSLAPLISSMRFGGGGRAGSSSSSSRGSEEPTFGASGVPPSIRDSAAANLKPTAEEYRALSSKEKRQLRNKISARNFRERRKGE